MKSSEIRQLFLNYFKNKEHAILPSASLLPENDPSVLFNTAGMQPLVPYLLGQKHPAGNRLASSQKCIRTGDIEEVGNHKNLTFFEMLGNWSLGDYFKKEAIQWSYDFLTNKQIGLGLDPKRLYVTVFEGDSDAPRDLEAFEIWKTLIPEHRIYFLPKKNNWWSPGDTGPCGPDTEMFYDVTAEGLGDLTHEQYLEADELGQVVEIWNDVFMEYEQKDGIVVGKLNQKNVDTGSGLERITMIVQGKNNVYESDLFSSIMEIIKKYSENKYDEKSARILADHLKSSAMLIADGVYPGSKDQGYILRRLIRRATMRARNLAFFEKPNWQDIISEIFDAIYKIYQDTNYLTNQNDKIKEIVHGEISKFLKTLEMGLKEFNKGIDPFVLATTFGFPIELTKELADEKGIVLDLNDFSKKMKEHQDLSKTGAEQKFKGGMGGTTEKIIKSHTAHHLLLAALRLILGDHVHQRGSNITEERIRIDFSHSEKMSDTQIELVENKVNEWINMSLPVNFTEIPKAEAEKIGAEMEFGIKYPDIVTVYYIGQSMNDAVSKEFCGGPHIKNTKEIGKFKIIKEEASSQGVRRIKAEIF